MILGVRVAGDADVEGAAGDATGVAIFGDAYGEGVAGDGVVDAEARTLYWVGGADDESAVGDASGVFVAGDAGGEGVAGDAPGGAIGEGGVGGALGVDVAGDADSEGAAGDAMVDGVSGDALMVRVLQGMLPLTVPLVLTTVRMLQVMILGVGPRHSWRRAWWALLVGWLASPSVVGRPWCRGGSSRGGGCRW